MSDIILDACMKFHNYPIKTVGGGAFLQLLYIIPLFQKFQKIAKNTKMIPVLNLEAIRLKL